MNQSEACRRRVLVSFCRRAVGDDSTMVSRLLRRSICYWRRKKNFLTLRRHTQLPSAREKQYYGPQKNAAINIFATSLSTFCAYITAVEYNEKNNKVVHFLWQKKMSRNFFYLLHIFRAQFLYLWPGVFNVANLVGRHCVLVTFADVSEIF